MVHGLSFVGWLGFEGNLRHAPRFCRRDLADFLPAREPEAVGDADCLRQLMR
jgi:hypothetical protein